MKQLFDYFARFNVLSDDANAAIAEITKEVCIAKGKELQPTGHICKTIYFIKKGIARIYYHKDGVDITDRFALENTVIARVESLFTGAPSRKAIQIIEDAEILAIDAPRLFKLYDVYPEIERLFRKIFEANHVELVNRIEGIQFHSAEERYKALLEESPTIVQRIPLKYIASFLGITQVSLSRIRGQR
jgi:CRP-like cAMP-binding protein